MSEGPRELMETVFKRIDFLDALNGNPSEKRALVDQLDVSRSTVNRGIWDLEQFGLVEYADNTYRLTVSGRLLHEQYTEYENNTRTVAAATDLLHYLPADAPLSMNFLRGADIFVSEDPVPHVPTTVLTEIIDQAHSLRGFSRTHAAPKTVDALKQLLDDNGLAEIVFREEVYDHVRSTYDWFSEEIAAGTLRPYLVDDLPYGLVIADQGNATYGCLVVYDEESGLAGVLVNGRDAAVTWVTNLFESYRDQARSVSELEAE